MTTRDLLKKLLGGLDNENQLEKSHVHVSLEKNDTARVFIKFKGKTQVIEITAKNLGLI